ncbi:MAG: GxxExxY protein [Gemmatimonadaceae bacterium]|nr:GxxExxY protein [Gemmatimonadaceae bacterium]NUQ92489.1 GxxExxY protein [Gemmatimonadaceae bacterium]NUR19999.1 GxxExxY protein [Gemmatimonadaceae bacterium]
MSPVDDALTEEIIGGGIEVHKFLGPGALESSYENCLAFELGLRGLEVQRQVYLPLRYKGFDIDAGYRIDLIVEGQVIVEVKAVEHLHPICTAQLLTYMKLSGISVGLLCNCHVELMKDGIRRLELKDPVFRREP